MHPLIKFAAGALSVYVIYCGFVFIMQRQIIFPRFQIGSAPGLTKPVDGLEKIWITTRHGKVETWLLPPQGGYFIKPVPAVIFAHGNAELIDFLAEELRPFTKLGLFVLLVEYPGYGRSKGKPSQESIRNTFTAAYDMLVTRKDVDPHRIVLFGRSVGGGAACLLAAQRPSAALILQSSFKSVRSFAARFLVPDFLVRDPFDNLSVVRNYEKPVLVIHGKNDEIIPFAHGVALESAARNGKMIAYRCGHNDLPPDPQLYWYDIRHFLQTNGILEN
jgi:fermentation-respiration switch protein FrsA (DUF1100 family)